jgi:dihydropyrimidinase
MDILQRSGQEAALAGGTTMHIDFALPFNHDLLAGFEIWKEKAKKSVMDYGFHMAVTSWNDKVDKPKYHPFKH